MLHGSIEDGTGILANGARLDVADHSDDLIGHIAAGDSLAQRAFAAENTLHECLVDDSGPQAGWGSLFEVAAREKWNAEGLKVAGRNHVEVGSCIGRIFTGLADYCEAVAAVAVGERSHIGYDGGLHSRQSLHALHELGKELARACC